MISLHGFQKPLAGRRGVARNQIQQNMNAALMGLDEQALQILVCAIAWRYGMPMHGWIAQEDGCSQSSMRQHPTWGIERFWRNEYV